MCLGVPAEVISIDGEMAKVSIGGTIVNTSLQLQDDVIVGDYVLIHSGYAISKLSKEDADETMRLLHELEEFHKEMD